MLPFTTSIAETAQALGLGRTKTYELINEGRLETVKIGRRRLVKVQSIRRLLGDQS
jgi:excisionase family DNA binding protein